MKKSLLIKIIFITAFFVVLFSISNSVKADFNPEAYKPGSVTRVEAEPVFGIGEKVYGALMNVATVVAILTIAIIGLRYIFASVEQKAEYKATMLPWFIGAILIVTLTSILGIVEQLAKYI